MGQFKIETLGITHQVTLKIFNKETIKNHPYNKVRQLFLMYQVFHFFPFELFLGKKDTPFEIDNRNIFGML